MEGLMARAATGNDCNSLARIRTSHPYRILVQGHKVRVGAGKPFQNLIDDILRVVN